MFGGLKLVNIILCVCLGVCIFQPSNSMCVYVIRGLGLVSAAGRREH